MQCHAILYVCTSYWWLHCLKCPLRVMLKCGLVFLNIRTFSVKCLTEKIHVLGKLHLGMSYSTVGHEFNINESTTYIKLNVSKEKHLEQGYVLIGWQKCEQRPAGPNHLFPLGVVVQYLLIQYLW